MYNKNKNNANLSNNTDPSNRLLKFGKSAAAVGTVAAVAFLTLPRHSAEVPAPVEKSYIDQAQEQAQIPLNKDDKIIIDGIRLRANNPDKNSASEAILSNKDVKEFIAENPDEQSGITASAMVAPEASEYALVERDINDDGEDDTIAVPVETSK